MLIDGGSQYLSPPIVTAPLCPTAVLSAVLGSYSSPTVRGAVVSLLLVADGVGCGSGQGQVVFLGGGGSGAAASYVLQNGKIASLILSNRGSSYTYPPNATIIACPSAVLKTAITLDAGDSGLSGVSSVMIQSGGVNCSNQAGNLGFDGGGAAAGTYTVIGGSVAKVQLTSSGSGYSMPPNVTALNSGCTVPPVITASISQGYGSCLLPTGSLVFSGGGGYGAAGSYTASGGVVTTVTLTSGGRFYTSAPTVTFSDSSCNFNSVRVFLSDPKVVAQSRYISKVISSSSLDRGLSLVVGTSLPDYPSSATTYNLSSSSTPISVQGALSSPVQNTYNSFTLDYNTTTVSRQYVDWDLRLSTSLQSLKGGTISNCLSILLDLVVYQDQE